MELRYCDSCGAVARIEPGKMQGSMGRFLCPKCSGDSPTPADSGARRQSLPVTGVDDSPLAFLNDARGGGGAASGPDDDPLDLDSSNHSGLPRMGSSRRPARGSEPEAREKPSLDGGLTLFSSDTIIEKQLDFGASGQRATDRPEPAARADSGFDDSLTLFSEQTIVARKQKHFGVSLPSTPASGDDVEIKIAVEDSLDEDVAAPLLLEPNPAGSQVPAPTATRIKFHCPSCNSVLVVRPVKKTSKMVCPRCSERMFIDPDGQVATEHPAEQPDGVKDDARDGGTIVPNLHRSSARREGSAGHQRGSPSEVVERTVDEKAAELSRLDGAGDDPDDRDDGVPGSGAAGPVARAIPPVAAGVAPPGIETIMRQLQSEADIAAAGELTGAPARPGKATEAREEPRHAPRAAAGARAAEIERLERSDPTWAALLQAGFFGILLAAPLFLLGALMEPGDAAAGEESALHSLLERTGATVDHGLRRLVDVIGDLVGGS